MAAPSVSKSGRSIDDALALLLLRAGHPLVLIALTSTAVAIGLAALLTAPVVLSSDMTWDLLFNLGGAWHLRSGQVPHVDFHGPVGALNFALTDLGFAIVGPSPRALLVNVAIATVVLGAGACFAAGRRLPLIAAAIFVLFVCLLALRPANVGDLPNAYSFAMTYNRYGWSGTALIGLILFVPPRAGTIGDLVEMAIVAVLLAALFYLKVTYFAVALGSVAVALAVSPHVGARWRGWSVVLLIGGALMLAPFNASYISDLVAAALAGSVRPFHYYEFAEDFAQHAPYFAAIVVTFGLWLRGVVPLRVPVACAFLMAAGLALLSQNSQAHGVPLAIVTAFLLYQVLQYKQLASETVKLAMLAGLLLFPLGSILADTFSVVSYSAKSRGGGLHVLATGNLRGLAVPIERDDMLAAFDGGMQGYRLLNRARGSRPRYDLSPYEYVQTLESAASWLSAHSLTGDKIAVLDQINPFPFMLGLAPPRGGNLWSGMEEPVIAAELYFAEVDRVLVPKFPTSIAWTATAREIYAAYLQENFPHRTELAHWSIFDRQAPRPVRKPSTTPD